MRQRRTLRGVERKGFAILSALWFMVLLVGIGLHVATRAHTDRLAAINRTEAMHARAAAESGVEHARSRLARRLDRIAASAPGTPLPTLSWLGADSVITDAGLLGDAHYSVRVRDAGARIHLNLASEDELRSLFVALRVDAGRADRLAQAIADWRDGDDLRHPRGAERAEYLREGARALPSNARFRRVNDLRDVREVDGPLLELVSPFLTTAGSGRVNPNTAPEPVLLTIRGFTPEVVASLMSLRNRSIALTDAEQLVGALPSNLRAALMDRRGEWAGRLVFESTELEYESEGRLATGPARGIATGVLVRFGTRFISTERRVEAW